MYSNQWKFEEHFCFSQKVVILSVELSNFQNQLFQMRDMTLSNTSDAANNCYLFKEVWVWYDVISDICYHDSMHTFVCLWYIYVCVCACKWHSICSYFHVSYWQNWTKSTSCHVWSWPGESFTWGFGSRGKHCSKHTYKEQLNDTLLCKRLAGSGKLALRDGWIMEQNNVYFDGTNIFMSYCQDLIIFNIATCLSQLFWCKGKYKREIVAYFVVIIWLLRRG